MAPKSGTSFTRCPNCAAILLGADLEKHAVLCTPLSPLTEVTETNHGMVFDGIFYGKRVDVKDVPQGLTGWVKENSVLLHQRTADSVGAQIETPCLVSSGQSSQVRVAWPSDKVGKLEIGWRTAEKSSTNWDSLRPINRWTKCKSIVLHPTTQGNKRMVLSPNIAKRYLERGFFQPDSSIVIPFYGIGLSLKVGEIEGEEECESLCPAFSALNISASSSSLEQSAGDSSRGSPRTPNKKAASDMKPVPNSRQISPVLYQITADTQVFIHDNLDNNRVNPFRGLSDFGGESGAKATLQQFLIGPIKAGTPTHVRRFLVHGSTGLGKTHLLGCLSAEIAPVPGKFLQVTALLEEDEKSSSEQQRSCIFVDNFQSIVNDKSKLSALVLQMETFLDQLKENQWIVAACSDVDTIPIGLRRRFDIELELTVPSSNERGEILGLLSAELSLQVSTEMLISAANVAHGFTGADLRAVVRQCVSSGGSNPEESLMKALRSVVPSAMREVVRELPKVLWSEVGGEEEVKAEVRQAVEWPLLHPEAFRRLGIQPPKGILLYGPPGCSKTMIARAVATESGLNFLAVKGPEMFSKWVGESEKAMRSLFSRARRAAPSVIFFDEIDAVGISRGDGGGSVGDRVLAQLLTEIDGLEKSEGVTIIAATNRPQVLDPALLRPGRLDKVIYVPLPDARTREAIFELRLSTMPVSVHVEKPWLVERTLGYSGAEIDGVCKEAALAAMRESLDVRELDKHHFEAGLERIRPRISPASLQAFEEFRLLMG